MKWARFLRWFEFDTLWKDEKIPEAEQELEKIRKGGIPKVLEEEDLGQMEVVDAYLSLGKIQAARTWYQEHPLPHPDMDFEEVVFAYFSIDHSAFREAAGKLSDSVASMSRTMPYTRFPRLVPFVALLARAGRSETEQWFAKYKRPSYHKLELHALSMACCEDSPIMRRCPRKAPKRRIIATISLSWCSEICSGILGEILEMPGEF